MSELTSLERIMEAISMKEADCLPVAPYMGNYGAKLAGTALGEYCCDGQLMAEAQFKAWDILRQDVVVVQSDNYYIAEGFGVTVNHYPDSTPTLAKPAVRELKDIEKLKVPDPLRDGRMPVYIKAVSLLAVRLNDKVAIRGCGTGPFSLAGHLLGVENFLLELGMAQMEPDSENARLLRKLMELTTEALYLFTRAELDAGAHIIQAGDSLASTDVISPAMYMDWVFPYEKDYFSRINDYARGKGAASLLHICGNTSKILNGMAETGADIIELDHKVSLGEAKERVGHQVCLLGNLDPTSVLLAGSPQKVTGAAEECIKAAAQGGGFILGSGCEVAVNTPLENMKAMIAAARNFRY